MFYTGGPNIFSVTSIASQSVMLELLLAMLYEAQLACEAGMLKLGGLGAYPQENYML